MFDIETAAAAAAPRTKYAELAPGGPSLENFRAFSDVSGVSVVFRRFQPFSTVFARFRPFSGDYNLRKSISTNC